MNKRILSVLLSLILTALMMVTAVPAGAAPADPSVTITADPAQAAPGDTVTFTVTLGPTAGLSFFTFDLVIPEGLTFVDGSVNSDAAADMNYGKNLEFARHGDGTPFIQGYEADAKNYVSETSVDIATFRCKVNADATKGTYTVDIAQADFGDADNSVLTARAIKAVVAVGNDPADEDAQADEESPEGEELAGDEDGEAEDSAQEPVLTEGAEFEGEEPYDDAQPGDEQDAEPGEEDESGEEAQPVGAILRSDDPAAAGGATGDEASPDSVAADNKADNSGSPKTGDSAQVYVWLLITLASLACAAAVLVAAKRKGVFTK